MTPSGQKLFGASKTEANAGWADANDPWKTCDPPIWHATEAR